ncbi:MAG: hypothetical protein J5I98_25025 [Phaeodactylibacter sp.]|nr:hypothetical protein [Phaeodactylibacter sp.]
MAVNEGYPPEYGMLYKLDEKKGFRSSAMARLSYPFSRLNIAIHYALHTSWSNGGFSHAG